MKKNLLFSLSLICLGMGANAQNIVLNENCNSTNTLTPSGGFTSTSDGSHWIISSGGGTDEWAYTDFVFSSPLNFATMGKPIVSINAISDQTIAFSMVLVDGNGHITDNASKLPEGSNNTFNIKNGDAAKNFKCDFTGQFTDNWGNGGLPQGAVDSTNIVKLRISINPGWATNKWRFHYNQADSNLYKVSLTGSVKLDEIQIGKALTLGTKTMEVNSKISVYPNPSTGLVTLNLNNSNSDMISISVANVLGQEIYSGKTNESTFSIDLSGKAKGIYYISTQNNQRITTQRLFLN